MFTLPEFDGDLPDILYLNGGIRAGLVGCALEFYAQAGAADLDAHARAGPRGSAWRRGVHQRQDRVPIGE